MILIRDDLSVAALIKSLTGSLHDLRVRFGEVTLSLRFWNGGLRINAVVVVCRVCLGDMPGCILAGLLRQGCMSHTVLLQAKTRRCNKYKAAESPPFTDKTAAVPKRDFNTVQITARGPSHPRHPVENNPGDRHRPIHEATVATITSDDFLVQLAIQHSVMPDLLIDDPVYKFQVNSDSQTGFWGSTGDRRAKRTHFGELIGVENGPTVAVSGSFELFWFEASGAKDVDGGRLRTDQACSS